MHEPLPVLYSFRRCPYAMRARMALLSSAQPVELREVLLKDKPAAMVRVSPKATVPVLVTPDGAIIDESRDIMLWALERNDRENWLSRSAGALIDHNDGPFKAALDRYKYPNRFEHGATTRNEHRSICAATLDRYNNQLSEAEYLLGEKPTLADNAIFPFVRQCANVDRHWFDGQPWPHLQNWLERFLMSNRFEAAMRKYTVWQDGDDPLIFRE